VLGTYAFFAFRQPPGPVPAGQAAGGGGPPGGPPTQGQKPGGGPPGGFAIGVEAVPVGVAELKDAVAAVGSLKSSESVVLRPEIAGRIAAINFREGAAVERGAVLVALDASTQDAELKQAQASFALAQANLRRTEDLFARKFVSERAQDEAAANLKVVEANTQLAEARLRKTQIRAPFAGIVGIRNVSVGDYVKEGQELINLEAIDNLKVDFRLPEAYLGQVRRGQDLELMTDVLPDESFSATVDAIDPLLDAAGRSVSVRARLPNPNGKLRPGMFARVKLAFGATRQALVVPEEALIPAGTEQFVFRVREGKAERVKIRTGQRGDARVEVVEGLQRGDMVVTAGQLKLRDGAPVKLTPAGGAPRG